MFSLNKALKAWGTPGFNRVLKNEIEQLDAVQLPLQQGLTTSSYVAHGEFSAMVLRVSDDSGFIHVKAGIFYSGIVTGCSCADDPTPVSEQSEYCEVLLEISKLTGNTTVTLLTD